ncbi:hypothetical protein EYC84_007561 [Monilinia fructicola]|uniref:AA1-like domain-containing protein n=1 Tax=Monilinia fructicola TaxID=38448 RepID=A0A5M9JGY2_MONFR|nr:hypothetical protein EYC84_007561 [Monilinia fructicola]
MHFSKLLFFSGAVTTGLAQQFMVPAPWYVEKISIGNTRHGTGGFWSFNLIDTPTPAPQGLNVTCSYTSQTTYTFALDGAPVDAPCSGDPNVTFSLYILMAIILPSISRTCMEIAELRIAQSL